MKRLMVALAAVLGLVLAGCGQGADEPPANDVGGKAPTGPAAGAPADGGLSVEEALASDLDEPLAVRGFILADGEDVRLCDVLLESLPPQCGGDSLIVEGLSLEAHDTASDGDVRWTDSPVTLIGDVRDGSFIVSDTAA